MQPTNKRASHAADPSHPWFKHYEDVSITCTIYYWGSEPKAIDGRFSQANEAKTITALTCSSVGSQRKRNQFAARLNYSGGPIPVLPLLFSFCWSLYGLPEMQQSTPARMLRSLFLLSTSYARTTTTSLKHYWRACGAVPENRRKKRHRLQQSLKKHHFTHTMKRMKSHTTVLIHHLNVRDNERYQPTPGILSFQWFGRSVKTTFKILLQNQLQYFL